MNILFGTKILASNQSFEQANQEAFPFVNTPPGFPLSRETVYEWAKQNTQTLAQIVLEGKEQEIAVYVCGTHDQVRVQAADWGIDFEISDQETVFYETMDVKELLDYASAKDYEAIYEAIKGTLTK